jgi:hypothetical protein
MTDHTFVGQDSSYVLRQIQRCNRTLLTVNGILLAGVLLVIVLSRGYFSAAIRDGDYSLVIVIAPLLLVSVWNVGRALARRAWPETHPIAAWLAKYGPLDEVVREIDREMQVPVERLGRIVVTNSWVLQPDLYMLHACPFRHLIWAYPKSTQYAAHPAHFTVQGVMLWDRFKRALPLQCQGQYVGRLLELLTARAPGITIGYSAQLAAAAKKDWMAFVSQVDEARSRV